METLSYEIIFEIFLKLKGRDLFNFCNVNSEIFNFCQDEFFWKQKVLYDYPNATNRSNLTWKQFYLELFRKHNKPIAVFYNDQYLGIIWINNNDTLDEILRNANHLFLTKFPTDMPALLSGIDGNNVEVISWDTPTINPRGSTRDIENYYRRVQRLVYKNLAKIRRETSGMQKLMSRNRVNVGDVD